MPDTNGQARAEEVIMANISADAGHGGKKSVDSEIPLVPFIDLLRVRLR